MAEAFDLNLYYTKFDGKEYNSQVYTSEQKLIFEGKTLPTTLKYWFAATPKTNLKKESYSPELNLKIDVTAYNTEGNVVATGSRTISKTYGVDAEMISSINLSYLTGSFTVSKDESGAVTITRDSDLDE